MVPIRKRRLAASFSRRQELHESSNGGLHLYAGPKSNPSFEDPKLSSLFSPTIVKQDHLLLAGSGYGLTQRPAQKQVPAEAAAVKSKPYSVASCEVKTKKRGESLIVMKGGGNSRAMMMDHVQEYEGKHMHIHEDDDAAKLMDIKGATNVVGLAAASASDYTDRGDRLEECKNARHDTPCITELPCSDPAIADATDYPRKVLPLQLILMSSESRSTAAKIPVHSMSNNKPTQLHLTGIGSTISTPTKPHTPHRDQDSTEEKKASPTWRKARGALPSSAGGSSKNDISEMAGVKLRDEMKLRATEDAKRCSQNSSDQSLERPVSSWQGLRRARSFLPGGRVSVSFNETPNGPLAGCRPGVNAEAQQQRMHGFISEEENQMKDAVESTEKKKKATQTKRKPVMKKRVETLDNCIGNLKQETTAVKSDNNMKKKRDQSLQSTAQDIPIPADQLIGSVARKSKLVSKKRKRPILLAAFMDDDSDDLQEAPVSHAASASAAADDHSQPDFMRCRRKDGRRWRCREQVVMPGAPFCRYHTRKMREKHAASVARRLAKQLQGEASCPESRSTGKKSASEKSRVRSSPTSMAMQDRYGAGMQGFSEEEGEEDEKTAEHKYEEEEGGKHVHAKLGKQQVKALQEAGSLTTVKRRWRKKCKPCIRRLHDIHDRPRPGATDNLGFTSSFWEDTFTAKKGSPVISLPECLLNTDPNEWRSDFP